MQARKNCCCGPQNLPVWVQVIAYILVAAMFAVAILQFLNLIGGSMARCSEKPEWCKVGTPMHAILRYVTATSAYYLLVAFVYFLFVLCWRTERSVSIFVGSAMLFAFTIFFVIMFIHIFVENWVGGDLGDAPGYVPFVMASVTQAIFSVLFLGVSIKSLCAPREHDNYPLMVNSI